jgi:outer membrane protein TolC
MIHKTAVDSSPREMRVQPGLTLALVAVLCLAATGCARKYWRKQADELSYGLIRDKQSDPRWVVDRVKVETDPRSRFFEAFDPDFEPLPPDDLAAHEFMHWAYGRRGWKHWHEFGDQASVDNPKWLEPFGWPREAVEDNMGRPGKWPEVKLTLEDMIDLAYIHNRDYQTQIENVYLAALALTLQRFAFDVQFIGLNGLRPSGTLTLTDIPSTSDSATFSSNVGVQQLLPTGGQWLVNLANNTLWLFSSGSPSEATASTLSYSLVQPLLANGGRRFVMEGLTQAERSLLYAVRDLARYRQGFFTSIVAGGFTAGIQVGIQGVFSGTGPIPSPVPSIANGNGGFLGLIQLYQSVSNTEYNIRQLSEQLERLRAQAAEKEFNEPLAAFPAGVNLPDAFAGRVEYDADDKQLLLHGTLSEVETRLLLGLSDDPAYQRAIANLADRSNVLTTNQNIVQLETQLASTVNNLRQARVQYLNGFDQLKLWLGLPVDMNVTVDTSMLKPFALVDERLIRLQDRLNFFVLEPPPLLEEHPDVEAMRRVTGLMKRLDDKNPDLDVVRGLVDEMLVIRDDLQRDGVEVTRDDFRRFAAHRETTATFVNDYPIQAKRDPRRDERLMETLLLDFRESETELLELKEKLAQANVDSDDLKEALGKLGDLREEFLRISQNFSVIQIDLRVEMIELNKCEITMDDSVAVGLANRLDLMNLRGAVMDARRKVEVAANQLQAVINIVANGNIQTPPLLAGDKNPFDFRGKDSTFQLGLQFVTPVQLVAQRNAYRAALVGYQQARRNYQRTEDQVRIDCRTNWRNMEFTRRNFETLREQVRAATAQLDIAAEQTAAPAGAAPGLPAPGGAAPPGGGGGGGGAGNAQGLQIIQAVNSVLQAQNSLIIQWVAYEAFRLDMYNFMGTLEVDEEGYWTDEFYQARARAHRANPNRLYPPLEGSGGGYGPVESSPFMADASPVKGSGAAAATQPAARTAPPEPRENSGRIRLVSGEAPEAPQPKIPLPAARRKSPFAKGPAGSTTPLPIDAAARPASPGAESAPGRARVTR